MTSLARQIAAERRKLHRLDDAAGRYLDETYRRLAARFEHELELLLEQITAARAAGQEVRPGWLYAQERYHRLLGQLEEHTLAYLQDTIGTIETAKGSAVALAGESIPALTVAALGPAPRIAERTVLGSFTRLPDDVLERIVTNAGDGFPLGRLIGRIAPETVDGVRDALAFGVAGGKPVRTIADEVAAQANIPRNRAMTISRTEVLRAYREASDQSMLSSPAVTGWRWEATCDSRTCPVCWSMHGSLHVAGEPMTSHVACRCTQIPETPSWSELGFSSIPDGRVERPTGAELFASAGEDVQRAVLGPAKFDAYAAGDLALGDVVRYTRSVEWGPGLRTANLSELGLNT